MARTKQTPKILTPKQRRHGQTHLSSQATEKSRKKYRHHPGTTMLRFTPPFLRQPLDIPFPNGDLSLCSKCQKSKRSKQYCRQNQKHNGAPKTDAYICITMDDTCFAVDGTILNEIFNVPPWSGLPSNPYVYPEQVDSSQRGSQCAECKTNKYSFKQCRTKKKHRALPETTAYITLTLARNANRSIVPLSMSAPASTGGAICQSGSVTAPHQRIFLVIVSSTRNEAMVRDHVYCAFWEKSYF